MPRSCQQRQLYSPGWVLLVVTHFALCSLLLFSGPDARHHGQYDSEGQLFRGVPKNWVLLRDDVTLCVRIQRSAGYVHASVCGVEEFHVFPRGKWTLDPVVDPRPFSRAVTSLLSLVFSTLQGFFCSPLHLAVTCTVFGVRLWTTGLWTFLGDHFRNGFRIHYSLVRQWIHVRRQSIHTFHTCRWPRIGSARWVRTI